LAHDCAQSGCGREAAFSCASRDAVFLARFLSAAREDEYGVLLAFALQTGLRPEEYIGLCRPELDLEKCQVHVRRTVVPKREGGWYWSKPKTKKGYRTVSFPQSLARELAEHLRKQSEHRLRLGQMHEHHDLVFPTETGVPLCRAAAPYRHFKKVLKSAGLDTKMRLYDLRHSYVTLSLIARVDVKTMSEQAGHASAAFTLDNYAHVLSTMKQGASDKLENLLRYGAGTL
jgi:integrase